MKFMPNRDLDVVTSSLNFSTPDLHVVGGCDLYTTKASGGDKKLYKNIENGLEAQYKSNLQFSKSLSPPQKHVVAPTLNLSRSSPFGNMGMISSRRTYAYLIATLNASHPHYDFSHVLRPTDFKREKSLRHVLNTIDTTMYNLRPRPFSSYAKDSAGASATQPYWGPSMWRLIDQQMSLRECAVYRYAPEDLDPFEDDDEGSIWSMNYFFFNKARKRVCYLYLRGISVLAVPSIDALKTPIRSKRFADEDIDGWITPDMGASKRARYWLGDRDDVETEDEPIYSFVDTTVVTADNDGTPTKSRILQMKSSSEEQEVRTDDEQFGPPARPVVDEHDNYILSDEEVRSARSQSKSTARGVSEEVVGRLEV
ncbi:RNA polymerase III-inhibiting protein maf1 [Cladophialophora chaetospira]|uniref:RNA polymerase III-inhibiting protein maf1 n=1 Tax=Cladophialophora chaetospira TaxID=386627 RepID=A0AA39CEK4_9EURO|nr:RNA polymerase III-inhibiting protein maf1 [Cladophialophora chaetospira]